MSAVAATKTHRLKPAPLKSSTLAQFMPGQVTQAIVGGVFVQFGKRWKIKNHFDERINRSAGFQHRHAEMNQFGGILPENLHPEQLPRVRAKNQFQNSGGVADD